MTDDRKQYLIKYQKENLKQCKVWLSPEEKFRWDNAAHNSGCSLQSYIKRAVEDRIVADLDQADNR